MTNEAVEKLAEKHGGAVIDYSLQEGPQATDTTIIIATSDLAALIAEVEQRVALECAEKCCQIADRFARSGSTLGEDVARACASAIRNLTGEEGK